MDKRDMSLEAGTALGVSIKAAGIKVMLGMAGAAILYMVAPPKRPDGSFNEREFAIRLAVAGFFSFVFGDWFIDVVNGIVPALMSTKHPHPFYVMAGAPGWWISRGVALFLYRRQDKDIKEVVDEIYGKG